jgi:hypothetical protein
MNEKRKGGRPPTTDGSALTRIFSYKAAETLTSSINEALATMALMGVRTTASELQRTAVAYFCRNVDKLAHHVKGKP